MYGLPPHAKLRTQVITNHAHFPTQKKKQPKEIQYLSKFNNTQQRRHQECAVRITASKH